MKKCDPRVYARCPDRCLCGSFNKAIYVEGSPCDLYNERMLAEPMTNADRIRSMRDEELALFLSAWGERSLAWYSEYGETLDYLQQSAEKYISEDINRSEYISEDIRKGDTNDVVPVVHGEWVEWYPLKHMIMTGEELLYCCSVCDAKYSDVEGYRHCPYCGARMDGSKHEAREG